MRGLALTIALFLCVEAWAAEPQSRLMAKARDRASELGFKNPSFKEIRLSPETEFGVLTGTVNGLPQSFTYYITEVEPTTITISADAKGPISLMNVRVSMRGVPLNQEFDLSRIVHVEGMASIMVVFVSLDPVIEPGAPAVIISEVRARVQQDIPKPRPKPRPGKIPEKIENTKWLLVAVPQDQSYIVMRETHR